MPSLDPISFARGAPSPDIMPADELREAAGRILAEDPKGALGYGVGSGYAPLRQWIADRHGVDVERVLVTNGSLQAGVMLFDELVEPGETVVVEAPSYDRTLLSLRKRGADILAIPLEEDGIDVSALASALEAGARPKLAHIIPNFQNPAGATLSLDKRRRLLELAQREQRAVVRGPLDHDRVARLHLELEQEGIGLHRAVGGEHLLALHAVALGDPVAERAVAAGRAVRERALRIGVEGGLRGRAEILDGDDVERGRAAGEGDRRGLHREPR